MGPSPRPIEEIACPECGVLNRVTFTAGSYQSVHYYCPICLPHYVTFGSHLPGLPSDLSYLRKNGQRLIAAAYSSLREEITQRRRAAARAEALLRQHLNRSQICQYLRTGDFDVPSAFGREVTYRISVTDTGGRASARASDVDEFVRGLAGVPQLGIAIRNAGVRAFQERGAVAFCLRPMGPALPAADTALSLKLFLEVDETRAWIKGTRIYLGAAPERIRFMPYAEGV